MAEIWIKIEEEDSEDKIHNIVSNFFTKANPSQQKLSKDNNEKKVLYARCQKNLYDLYDADEVTKIINFCNVKYKSKVYCRDCQELIGGGSP